MRVLTMALVILAMLLPGAAQAEDGHDLWLRYHPLDPSRAAAVAARASHVVADQEAADPTIAAAAAELRRALTAMVGTDGGGRDAASDGRVLIGTTASPAIRTHAGAPGALGDEGFMLRSIMVDGRRATLIAADRPVGVLYGAFALIRLIQTGGAIDALDMRDAPRVDLRLLNHWDNLDRTVERGYAGQSLWDWQKLPGYADPRYTDYARANASIGINGTVLNNVNAHADILTAPFLTKVAALADIFRPYGIRVYLSARFTAPRELGGLDTADPLDPRVAAWWAAKADEIYAAVPDFGGFLVKANSEGQPGPQDYDRTHADGANMLADAVGRHGGVVMWRAFVYEPESGGDRATQAYDEFKPLDGQFRDNVIVQVKNGAIDFQPREPFHPLFGAMPQTPVMAELQITKEYLGFATHLAYLGPMWAEFFGADTMVAGPGSTVARVIDGSLQGQRLTGIAGVANTGTDRNWSGSQFDQANWYAFGRMAWDPTIAADRVAEDWARMTWGSDPDVVRPIVAMMMRSREAVVDYTGALGLHHLFATSHHYGPGPWVEDLSRPDWNPVYYHKADRDGVGFDRTASGSDAVAQYAPPVAARFADPGRVGEDFLLWFHRRRWDDRVASGRTLWDELVTRYDRGVETVRGMRRDWAALDGWIDAARHAEVAQFLAIHEQEALWWRDASIAYFQSINRLPLPAGHAPPPHDLDHYKAIAHPHAPGI